MSDSVLAPQLAISQSLTTKQAETLLSTWEAATTGAVPTLLQTRGVPAYQTASRRGAVFVPMQDSSGQVSNLQRLSLRKAVDETQQLAQSYVLKDLEILGLRHVIGEPSAQEPILFTTDYLSGASLHQSTGLAVVVTFDASNQDALVEEYRKAFPEAEILICGDTSTRTDTGSQGDLVASRPVVAPIVTPSEFEGFSGGNFNDLQLQFGPKALKSLVDKALQAQADLKQENAKVKTVWSGEWELRENGLNAVRAVVASTGNPPVFTGGSQESVRGVEKDSVWDTETFGTEALARQRATALANKVLEDNGPDTQATVVAAAVEAVAQPLQSSIEGVDTNPVKISEVDATLARLKLQYLLANDKYYLRDENKTLAFEDTGKRLVTAHESAEIARSMVELSKAKGWTSIKVGGSDTFKRKVWVEAELLGIKTQGYTPDAFDQNELQKRRLVQGSDLSDVASNTIVQVGAAVNAEPTAAAPKPQGAETVATEPNQRQADVGSDLAQRYGTRLAKDVSQALAKVGIAPGSPESSASLSYIADLATSPRSFVGKLLEHGPAPYEFKEHATPSYYAKLQTAAGEKVVWGVDIPRALAESIGQRVQTGDQILLAFRGSQPVTVKDELTGKEISTHRNTWYTEKISELPSVAVKAEQKPSYSTYGTEQPSLGGGAPSAKEQVLIDVLQSKGAPAGAIAAVRASLAANTEPVKAPQPQSTVPVSRPSV